MLNLFMGRGFGYGLVAAVPLQSLRVATYPGGYTSLTVQTPALRKRFILIKRGGRPKEHLAANPLRCAPVRVIDNRLLSGSAPIRSRHQTVADHHRPVFSTFQIPL